MGEEEEQGGGGGGGEEGGEAREPPHHTDTQEVAGGVEEEGEVVLLPHPAPAGHLQVAGHPVQQGVRRARQAGHPPGTLVQVLRQEEQGGHRR